MQLVGYVTLFVSLLTSSDHKGLGDASSMVQPCAFPGQKQDGSSTRGPCGGTLLCTIWRWSTVRGSFGL